MKKRTAKSSEELLNSKWAKVRCEDAELPNGQEISDFYVVSLNEVVAIAGLDIDGNLILTRQHRHPYGRDLIELPVGAFELEESDLSLPKENSWKKQGMLLRSGSTLGQQ